MIVTRSDTCAVLPPAPPSPWPIIKTIAEVPNDWALKAAFYEPPFDVREVSVHKKQNPAFNLHNKLDTQQPLVIQPRAGICSKVSARLEIAIQGAGLE